MRFRANIQNLPTFTKIASSLATLGNIAWLKLDADDVRFTVIPERGSQVWSVLTIDIIFEDYVIQSQADNNAINLEVPLAELVRALKSAKGGSEAAIRLTKKDGVPVLSLTIATMTLNSSATAPGRGGFGDTQADGGEHLRDDNLDLFGGHRETTVTQDIPIRVLAPASVEGLHQPRCREPDVHIVLPNLLQLKSISDRFTRLAMEGKSKERGSAASGPKLELSSNAHGCLRLALKTDTLRLASLWTGLENAALDPAQVEDGEEGLANHPSTKMKELGDASGRSEEGWATVRVDGKDWGQVLSVGRLGGRVVACLCHEHAVILYVFIGGEEEGMGESVLTYYISSYSA